MRLPRVRFSLRWLMIAVAIMGVLFAALQYDVGMRGYVLFLLAFAAFALSALIATRMSGRARIAALSVAVFGCLIGWAVFLVFGTR
jgi:hypothetical protein